MKNLTHIRIIFSVIISLLISFNCLGQFDISTQSNNGFTTTTVGNTVTISYSGSGDLNITTLAGYLNAGQNVIIQPSTVSVNVPLRVLSNISKTAGGDVTLTLKSNGQVRFDNTDSRTATGSISCTLGKLNVIIWVGANGGNENDNARLDDITTNGGHIWVGGGAGTKT